MSEEIYTEHEAYEDAVKGYSFDGEELQPYSDSRVLAGQSMGIKFPALSERDQKIFADTNLYPGAMQDTVMLIWLCTLPDNPPENNRKAWTPRKAAREPESAYDEAVKWGTEKGIITTEVNNPKFIEAYGIFMGIVSGIAASEFKLESSTPSSPDEAPKV